MKKNSQLMIRLEGCVKIDKIIAEETHCSPAFQRFIDDIVCGPKRTRESRAYLDGYWDGKADRLIRDPYPTNEKEVHVS
jgi:hypothetical protein